MEINWVCDKFRKKTGNKLQITRSLSGFCRKYKMNEDQVELWLRINDGSTDSSFLSKVKSESDLAFDILSMESINDWANNKNDIRTAETVLYHERNRTNARRFGGIV